MSTIVRTMREMQPLLHYMPPIQTRHLTGVKDSYVRCRLCLGGGTTFTASPVTLTYTEKHCQLCGGSKVMSNRESTYEPK